MNTFKPAWWLRNPHLQTLYAARLHSPPQNIIRHERLELPDGDFLDLAWADNSPQKPIVLLLHGLTGSMQSHYIQRSLKTISDQGWRGVLMHFRGCSGEPNRLERGYHSGETNDLDIVITKLLQENPNVPIFVVGFSLGGNVLLKYLGETLNKKIKGAVAISIPFELRKSVMHLSQGFSRIYQKHLVQELKRYHHNKCKRIPTLSSLTSLEQIHTLFDFDDRITAPLHGFEDANDYYQKSSSRQYLKSIKVPTLILQAQDDPFVPQEAMPTLHELSEYVTLELTEHGGHVGFMEGTAPWRIKDWLGARIMEQLTDWLETN